MRPQRSLLFISIAFGFAQAQNNSESLPVVDLGYALYRASAFETGGFYNFSSIRYAEPPLGDLRFRAPQPPAVNRSVIQDGKQGKNCPQAIPDWAAWTSIPGAISNIGASGHGADESEDCLFLDVIVPQKVFEKARHGPGVPVLVHIHGGGYVVGSKTYHGDPYSMLSLTQTNCSDGMIFVAFNYRLGAFGWLAGPSVQKDGVANAGLYDQRMALEWVQNNIHLFGGDKDRVTVIGESAGGGSIVHQVTAYGGRSSTPFQQAITQSPGWVPLLSSDVQEERFQGFLRAANVTSLSELRNLPSEELLDANSLQISKSNMGQYTFGPAVDGIFVQQDPKQLLVQGKYDPNVRFMVGHTSNEGLGFTPTNVTSDTTYNSFVEGLLLGSDADADVLSDIESTVYPPVSNDTQYSSEFDRAALTSGDIIINCNAVELSRAYGNQTYAYLFAVAPGVHGQDFVYTYYSFNTSSNSTVGQVLQEYIVSFVTNGKPTTTVSGAPDIDFYGADSELVELDTDGITKKMDPSADHGCEWWLDLVS